jgi:hypothetical protein
VLGRLLSYKHSSLFCLSVSDEKKEVSKNWRQELFHRRRYPEGRRVCRHLDHLQAARHPSRRQADVAPVGGKRRHLYRRSGPAELRPDQSRQRLPADHPVRHDRLHQEHHQDPVQS